MVVGSRHSSNDSIFYLCTLLRGKTEGVRDLKSDTSAYLLERVFPSQRGIKSRMFFSVSPSLFFFIIILRHCAPPSSLKTMHILPGESSNITTLLHRYSSLGPLTFSYPFPTPPLFLLSALPPSPLLICLPIRRPSFHVLPTPYPLRSAAAAAAATAFPPPLPHYLYFGGAQCTPSRFPSFAPYLSLTFHLHMRVLILKSWPTTDIQY